MHIITTLDVLNDLKPTNTKNSSIFPNIFYILTLEKWDKIPFGQCTINLRCWYSDKYIGKYVWFATFSTYAFYLRAHVEFSPDHFLRFEAVAVSPRGKSSPSVVFAPFAYKFLSPDWAPAPAQVGCACTLLNIVQTHEIVPLMNMN